MASPGGGIDAASGSWSFGGETPLEFDEHAARSIPWYQACHELVVDLADRLVPAGGRCYELGCSTGALSALLASRLAPRRAEVVGVDAEPGMVELARQRCTRLELASFETARIEELGPSPPRTSSSASTRSSSSRPGFGSPSSSGYGAPSSPPGR